MKTSSNDNGEKVMWTECLYFTHLPRGLDSEGDTIEISFQDLLGSTILKLLNSQPRAFPP